MRGAYSLHPHPLGGLFLYFGSELGGGDGTSDPSADGRASCLKKSAGEWYRGHSRLDCAPESTSQPCTHTHPHMHKSTHVPHHGLISSSLTGAIFLPFTVNQERRACREGAKGQRGRRGGVGQAYTPSCTHRP